ncbi:ER membrane protein complex subunit 4-like isoform X2 [Dipodomys merriami]|uniref:ER membrane protein complex subunit 4-like isoform X2 n=1 Tax=Dipodomys merriami TaxID=94247 RepID=UPI003855B896
MTSQRGPVANRGWRFKWAIELCRPAGTAGARVTRAAARDSLYPVCYLDKQVLGTRVQEEYGILVEKYCWDITLSPLKQIPINFFIMYMASNTISIMFPTMMMCMVAWWPIQASISATFKILEKNGVQ